MNRLETPSVEWVLNELHVIEQFQSRVEGDQNPSAVALRRAIEIIVERYPTATLQSRVKELEYETAKIRSERDSLLAALASLRKHVDEEFKERDLDWRTWPLPADED